MLATKQPFTIDGDRLVAGRISVISSHPMDAPEIKWVRMLHPNKPVLGEPEIIWLLFQSIWEKAPVWWPMWKEAVRVTKKEPVYFSTLHGIVIRSSREGELWEWEFSEDVVREAGGGNV